MMRVVNRLALFFSLFLLYLIFKEVVSLVHYTRSIHPYLMYALLVTFSALFIYLVMIPLIRIFSIAKIYQTTSDRAKIPELRRIRIDNFRKNDFLIRTGFDVEGLKDDEESYNRVMEALGKQCNLIRKKYVMRIFFSTGLSQNGFLDAFFILSGTMGMIKEIFLLYHGRVPDRELWKILKKVYYSMAIGGSGLIEFVVEEFMSKVAGDLLKSIPFINKIFSSVADGYVNAAIFTWISLITENYCRTIYLESDRDLYPSRAFFLKTFKDIVTETTTWMKERFFKGKEEFPEDLDRVKKGNLFHRMFGINPSF